MSSLHAVEELAMFFSSWQEKLPTDLWSCFLLKEEFKGNIMTDFFHNNFQKSCKSERFYLQHPITLPFEQTTVTETDRQQFSWCYWNFSMTSVNTENWSCKWERWHLEVYLQCLLGSLSRAMALCPQGHLKKRLTASCHRKLWFCSTQRSAGLKYV